MKAAYLVGFLLAVGLAACGPSPAAVQQTVDAGVAQTQAAVTLSSTSTPLPQSTPTLVPLSELDLKGVLVPNEDLPDGYIATKTKDTLPNLNVPEPLKLIWQQLEKDNQVAGGVRIYLYESKIDVEDAYKKEAKSNKAIASGVSLISDVGEMAQKSSYDLSGDTISDLVFARCYAVASIRMSTKSGGDDIVAYAKALDERLKAMVCR